MKRNSATFDSRILKIDGLANVALLLLYEQMIASAYPFWLKEYASEFI